MRGIQGDQVRFLVAYARRGGPFTIPEFCESCSVPVSRYSGWRQEVEGFADTFDFLARRHALHPNKKDRLVSVKLTEKEQRYLREFAEHGSKSLAMAIVEWDIEDLEKAMMGEEFVREEAKILRMIDVEIKDAVRLKAKDGSISHARLHFQDQGQDFGPAGAEESEGKAFTPGFRRRRQTYWKDRYGSISNRPSLEPLAATDDDDGMAPN